MSLRHTLFALSALAAGTAPVACNDALTDPDSMPQPVGDSVALTTSGKVLNFNRNSLGNLLSSPTVKGLKADEKFLGIDVRPQDKLIYGVTNQGNLYTLDESTGQTTFKFALKAGAATTATCAGSQPAAFTTLKGTEFAFDFNPVADRLRVASDMLQNLRINVADGTVVVDCPISYTGGTSSQNKPTAAAYTAATTTTPATTKLYYIDSGTNALYTIDTSGTDSGTKAANNANNGILVSVGALGADIGDTNGFDIDAAGTGWLVATVGTNTFLYTVNLSTGAATQKVQFPDNTLRGLALR